MFRKNQMKSRRGSSLVYLGYSVVLFFIVYGILFYIASIVLSTFFSALAGIPITNADWSKTNTDVQKELQFIIPLMPTIGIMLVVVKSLMTASVKGND